MKFNKRKVRKLNDLLNEVRKHREEVISIIEKICPNKECDPSLETNKEALKCPYFTLCNVMGSYSLMSKEEQEKADEFLELYYSRLNELSRKKSSYYV